MSVNCSAMAPLSSYPRLTGSGCPIPFWHLGYAEASVCQLLGKGSTFQQPTPSQEVVVLFLCVRWCSLAMRASPVGCSPDDLPITITITRNGPQNHPFCPGSLQDTFYYLFLDISPTYFPKTYATIKKSRESTIWKSGNPKTQVH